jgi:hypothetical protein
MSEQELMSIDNDQLLSSSGIDAAEMSDAARTYRRNRPELRFRSGGLVRPAPVTLKL